MTSRIDYNNPNQTGKFGLSYHYEMVSDLQRVTPFKRAIQRVCKGKRVFESGTGTGIMSILAAKAGAKKVYASEIDPEIASFAQENINKNGFRDVIEIIHKDTRDISLKDLGGERVNVAIAENLSTWQVTEPEISVFNHINKELLKPDGISIPGVIYNYFELAFSNYRFEDVIDLKTYFFEFSGISHPKIMSDKILFSEIDLRKIHSKVVEKSVIVSAKRRGVVNSVRLTSPLKIFDTIRFSHSDSLMPPVVFPLEKEIEVLANQKIQLTFSYNFESSWDAFTVKAELL